MDKTPEKDLEQSAKNINEQIIEALREAQATFASQQTTETMKQDKPESTAEPTSDQEEPAWFKKYREEQAQLYQQLRNDNETLKAAKLHEEQHTQIASAAERIGIPDYLVSHLNIDPDGDIEQQLTHIKQEMVNHSLLPIDAQRETDANRTIIESEADEWASKL